MNSKLLQIENLAVQFQTEDGIVQALRGVDLEVYENEVVGLVGESGCGKTVLGLAIIGLLPTAKILPDSRIMFKDRDLTTLSPAELTQVRGTGISMIFQEPMTSLNPVLTISDQIAESIKLRQEREKSETRKTALENDVRSSTIADLRLVRIPDPERVANRYPHELSGGMKQRAMIAMCLAAKPSLLIADEPTTALDVTIQAQILSLMRDLMSEVKTSILFITHDLGVVADIADRVAVMYAGKIVEEAPVAELFKNPLHPYTQGLLRSLPKLSELDKELESLPGSVPSALTPPTGCSFHPRCKHVMDQCTHNLPRLIEVKPQHKVACYLY
jgi:peptide/nickel transport system ATP-binding protein